MIEEESLVASQLGAISDTVSQLQEDLAMHLEGLLRVGTTRTLCRRFAASRCWCGRLPPDALPKENVVQPAETSASTEAVKSLFRRVQGMEVCNNASIVKIDQRLRELEAAEQESHLRPD